MSNESLITEEYLKAKELEDLLLEDFNSYDMDNVGSIKNIDRIAELIWGYKS